MKTRIKVETLNSGTVIYYPQKSTLGLFWDNIWWENKYCYYGQDFCDSLDQAKRVIDKYLMEVKEKKAFQEGTKTASIKYIKYP